MSYFVYILRCSDQSLYIGSTNNLEKRVNAHNELKTGAKYTKSRRPVQLIYSEKLEFLSQALRREISLKKLPKLEKEQLVRGNH